MSCVVWTVSGRCPVDRDAVVVNGRDLDYHVTNSFLTDDFRQRRFTVGSLSDLCRIAFGRIGTLSGQICSIWNPRVPDYKNKDQRAQVWEDLEKILTAPKGTTHKVIWESLIHCHCNALQRTRTKKKLGSVADNSKPWKFLKQMEFLIPIKDIRNSKGNLPEASDEESETDADILQAAMEEADIVSEGDGVDVPEQAVDVVEKRKGSEQGGRKQKKKKVEDNEDPILSLMRKKLERKPESPRIGFFNSIMPRVETLEEDLFQEFQLQTLQLLKNLHAQQTQQGHFSGKSGQSSLSSHDSFTPIPSPLSSSMSSPSPSPSPSQSYYPPTALYRSQKTPQRHMFGQSRQSPMPPWQSSSWSSEFSQVDMGSQGSADYSQLGRSTPGPSNYDIQ
ncbi:uncharacterized protein LOC121381588 [Gigantopelta aegis]|uniref:uncharacterized protein LOC121381588 n=1 Tax=Gigantopelta aegis TaxID=1735272 RepID=UPI001B888FF6|nr:uncharacterized protein LOC121381588 [Gigantopelta aegis]